MGGSGIREPDYPGTIRYVLRRRDRSGFWTAIFLFAFSAALLAVATVSVATGYTSVAGVWDFLLFGLLAAACGIFELRDHAAILGQVLMAVGDAGIYLTEPFSPGGRAALRISAGLRLCRWPGSAAALWNGWLQGRARRAGFARRGLMSWAGG